MTHFELGDLVMFSPINFKFTKCIGIIIDISKQPYINIMYQEWQDNKSTVVMCGKTNSDVKHFNEEIKSVFDLFENL